MPERNWTDAQRDAIEARGGTLLVSAAAGSGKTAVLVERVIRRITDENDPAQIDRLLVVTYTRAAAAEMRERISKRLSEEAQKHPESIRIRRQQLLLPGAKICTVHSFCKDLITENFYTLGIAPDIRIFDDSEMQVLFWQASEQVLEELYSDGDTASAELLEAFGSEKNDNRIRETVIRMYLFVRSHPSEDKWLSDKEALYINQTCAAKTPWGKSLLSESAEAAAACALLSRQCVEECEANEALKKAYQPAFLSDLEQWEALRSACESGNWDTVSEQVREISFQRLGVVSKPDAQTAEKKEKLQSVRTRLKGVYDDKFKKCFSIFDAEYCEDIARSASAVRRFFRAVRSFSKKVEELKKERHALDFGDLEHLALSLLVRQAEDSISFSETAKELSERFCEVMVDEYQDTNETQDLIFRAVSGNAKHLFMVGDVKQSIYVFRQAMPQIFLLRRETAVPYRKEAPEFPAYLSLDRNFRSRRGVTDMVNFVFGMLMSKGTGSVDYAGGEKLVYAANYEEAAGVSPRLDLIESSGCEEKKEELEARHTAAWIRETLDAGTLVTDGAKRRPARPGDFCILLRSMGGADKIYAQELLKLGIPVSTNAEEGFFSTPEIGVALSLLRVIDNPMQDIPLLSVLMSPIYGFSPDDMVRIRLKDRRTELYAALLLRAEEGDSHCAEFIRQMEEFRALASEMPSDMLLRTIYAKTGYQEIVRAMKNGEERLENLRTLHRYAKKFEASGYNGLRAFIRFVDRLCEQRKDLSRGKRASGENAVQMMTIHKSKGLEFPFCVIGGLSKQFNRKSLNEDVLLHAVLGAGIRLTTPDGTRKYETMPRTAVAGAITKDEMSEEMRILYVAMTRAREKLLLVMTLPDVKKAATGASSLASLSSIPAYFVRSAGSMSEWILWCALRHPDGKVLRELAGMPEHEAGSADFPWEIGVFSPETRTREEEQAASGILPEPDRILMQKLKEKAEYAYPYRALFGIPAKVSASGAAEQSAELRELSERPAFLSGKGLTPAQRGTALHTYLEFASYRDAAIDPEKERERLVSEGYLTREQGDAVDLPAVRSFFQSPCGKRICAAEKMQREYRFTVEIPAKRIYPELSGDAAEQKILLQGAMDCVFEENGETVIVDYKTDRTKEESALFARYAPQLALYEEAARLTLGKKVKECFLYSFYLNREVREKKLDKPEEE